MMRLVKFMLDHQGDLYNHESLVAAIKSVDVVISAVGYAQLPDQTRIISAIKEAGNVKVTYFNSSICAYLSAPICAYWLYCKKK